MYEGILNTRAINSTGKDRIKVAVKVGNSPVTPSIEANMLNEMKINRKVGEHANIVKFIGASSTSRFHGIVKLSIEFESNF